MWSLVVAALIGFIITLLLTPLARIAALAVGLVDNPNHRRINTIPVPTGGGVALYFAFLVAALLLDIPGSFPLLLSGGVLLIVGLVDDWIQLSAGYKFAGQLLAVSLYVLFGTTIQFVTNPFGGMIYLGWLAIPVTIFWMLAVINVINFIDGLDGLATGVTGIASLALLSVAFDLGRLPAALVAAVLVGCAFGFLPFNFNPAKVFLGDAGALFLGFMLSAVAIEGALKGAATIGVAVPVLILALPVADTFVVILRRLSQGVPVYVADSQHFHHRMLALGLSQPQVALIAYALSGFSAGIALIVARTNLAGLWGSWAFFVLFTLVLWAISRPDAVRGPYLVKSQRRVI